MTANESALIWLLETAISHNPTSRMALEAREHLVAIANTKDTEALAEADRIHHSPDPSFGGQDAGLAGPGVATGHISAVETPG
jgi:hypothetical protein